MISDERINELRKKIRKGFPEGEIKSDMLRDGYTEDDIVKVFAPKKYDMRSWYLVFGLVFMLIGIPLYLGEQNILMLLFGVLLLAQYYRESQRLKKTEDAGKIKTKDEREV